MGKTEKSKLLTVIVPVYNVEKYLDTCIKSIINQTYSNLEIILVDDGSKDDSGRICDKYAEKDKRIKVIHKENEGLSEARNLGIKLSKGDYITFVDSDDYIDERMYEILIHDLEYYDVDIATCDYLRVEDYSRQIENSLSELLPDVRLLYGETPFARTPVMYEPGIIILFSGHKIGYINERVFRYDANEYLLLTVPLPFECETYATSEVPLAGVRLNVDILQLQELLMDIGEDEHFQPSMAASGINSATLSEEILCAAERLLDVMERPLDARILGKQIIREILYYVLTGPCGGALLALVSRQTHFSLISRVLKRIENKYTENLSVEQLAAEANMSVSAFHHNFKSVTSTSPLQYLKNYRLHKARMMIIHDGMKASAAAMRVGYESASQFSREFKRYFGVTPGEDAARMRAMQGN